MEYFDSTVGISLIVRRGEPVFYKQREKYQTDCVYEFLQENKTDYVGETKVRFGSRSNEHLFTDKKSAVYKFRNENPQLNISKEDFRILETGFTRKVDRKLAEALYIKDINPGLNEQVKSWKLSLFN